MKKNLFLLIILYFIISFASQAQTEKGSKLVGGGASIDFDPFAIGLYPRFGYFIINNLAIGAQLPLYYSNGNSGYNGIKSENISVGLSPFVRYYLGDAAKTRVFAGAFGGVSKSWQNNKEFGNSEETSNNVGLELGLVHFLTNQIGLEATLNYSNFYFSGRSRVDNLGLNLGFQIYLPGSLQE